MEKAKIFKGAYDVSTKAIELFKDADYSTLPHELVQVYKKKKLPRENWQH